MSLTDFLLSVTFGKVSKYLTVRNNCVSLEGLKRCRMISNVLLMYCYINNIKNVTSFCVLRRLGKPRNSHDILESNSWRDAKRKAYI
jgi:hypothetical protein